MEFSKQLLYVRAKLDLSQAEIAEKLNVTSATISRWESEKVAPTKKALMIFEQFCKSNNIDIEEI
jgi:transcriptional regulator with XRE-family HTH domain